MMKQYTFNRQDGVTLIEMMIAFALSAVLILGVVQIFESNKMASKLQGGIARVQESGRIATELMARDIRNASYMGCSTGGFSSNFRNVVDASKFSSAALVQALSLLDGDNSLLGFDDVTSISSGSVLANFGLTVGTATGNLKSGTDVLVLHNARPCSGGKVTEGGTGTAQLKIEDAAACNLDQGDIVIVSNCTEAEAFGITSNASSTNTLSHGSNWNTDVKLNGNYEDDSYIFKPTSIIFYIGTGTDGEPALYMRSLDDVTPATGVNPYGNYELATGVEDMQILYGEDTSQNQTVDRYVTASDVVDMNNVLTVRVRYLLRSADKVTTTAQTYTFNDATTLASDLRMRMSYETTNLIRNRIR